MDYPVDASALLEGTASGSLGEWMRAGWGKLTVGNILYTLALLLACLAAVRLVMALAEKLTARTALDGRVRTYVLRGLRALLYVLTALVAAGSLGVDVTSLVAMVSVFGLAVSLAVQDMLSNVAGGIVLLVSKPFTLGDYVDTGCGEGEVAEIGLTHTRLDAPGGQRIMLPNSRLVAGKIVNYSVRGVRRADLTVCASYDDSAQAVRAACLRAVSRTENILPDPAPAVVVTAYGESAIEYHVRFWTRTEHFWDAQNAVLEGIRQSFAEDGITMTYNHLNVHLVDENKPKEK